MNEIKIKLKDVLPKNTPNANAKRTQLRRIASQKVMDFVSAELGVDRYGLTFGYSVMAFAKHYKLEVIGSCKDWITYTYITSKELFYTEKTIMAVKKRNRKKKNKRDKSKFGKNYKQFLKTEYWYNVRELVLNRDNNKCTKCSSDYNLQVHHTTYKNHMNELEHLEDLITLCRPCHEKEHNINQPKIIAQNYSKEEDEEAMDYLFNTIWNPKGNNGYVRNGKPNWKSKNYKK